MGKEIAPGLEFTKKWPAVAERLALQGNLHEIPESDYKGIEGLMGQQIEAEPSRMAKARPNRGPQDNPTTA